MGGSKKQDDGGAGAAIQAAGEQSYQRAKSTPEEQSQYQKSFETGNILDQINRYNQGLGQAPQGFLSPEQQYLQQSGPMGQAYYNQTLQGTVNPYAAYESQLQPALQLASQYVNQNMTQRGLLRSGMDIENMGRAGVELAIKEAQDRMNFRGQELARGGEMTQYAQGLGQQNYGNMANMYGQQQSAGQGAMNRQASAAQNAAQYQAYPSQAKLGSYYGKQGQDSSAMGGALGMGAGLLGASLIPFTGGMSAFLPLAAGGMALGGAAGSQIGRAY